MKRTLVRLTVLLILVLLLFVLLFGPGLLAAPITLLIGWYSSLARLIKAWHPSPGGVMLFALAVVMMVAGTHRFLRWVYAYARPSANGHAPREWRWKWTICGFGVLTCSLLAICAMVLTTHQVYWMSKSSVPLFTDPFRERLPILRVEVDLQKKAEEFHWDSAKTREFFMHDTSFGFGEPPTEAIQPIWIENDDHSLQAIVIIPRRPLHRAIARVTVLRPGTNTTTHRLEELPKVLSSLGIGRGEQSAAGAVTLLP